jgi:uncharacterized protein
MIADRHGIPYLHWQPRLARGVPQDVLGEIVHDLADVEQSIATIVLTEKGSVPTQPEKCTRLAPYIDRRPETAIPNITREIFDAITAFEPRVVVDEVLITQEDFGQFRFPVFWHLRDDVAREIRQTIVLLPTERIPGGQATLRGLSRD